VKVVVDVGVVVLLTLTGLASTLLSGVILLAWVIGGADSLGLHGEWSHATAWAAFSALGFAASAEGRRFARDAVGPEG
jgi:hypothetical protein